MADDLLRDLLNEVENLFSPLDEASRDSDLIFALLRRLGWEIDDLLPAASTLASSLKGISTAIGEVRRITGGGSSDISVVIRALHEMSKIPQAVTDLKQQLETALPVVANELAVLPTELLELLFVDWVQRRSPLTFSALAAIGLIESQTAIERLDANRVLRQPVAVNRLRLEVLSKWIKDPMYEASARFGIDELATEVDARAYALRVFQPLAQLVSALGAVAVMGRGCGLRRLSAEDELALAHMLSLQWRLPADDIEATTAFGLNITALSTAEGGPGIMLMPFGAFAFAITTHGWRGEAELEGSVDAVFLKPSGTEFPLSSSAQLGGMLELSRSNTNNRFGGSNGTRIELGNLRLTGQFGITPGSRDIGTELDISKAAFVFSAGDGDGFLQKILPKDGIRVDFDLTIGFSNKWGLYFKGGVGLEVTLPVNIDRFGVIKIDSVYLALLAKSEEGKESKIQAVTATTVQVKLGPVSALVERFGLQATLSFPEKGGNLGVANLDLGFKPPKGVGLTIQAQVVTGGGYLYFDPVKEQYAGVLQLEIAGKFSLSAVGLLTTKMPDGSKGFSLLVIISVRFDPGIQLGYGFSLNGLGGLLGVNRTAMAEVLREGLRRGALGSVLFPQNIAENAPQIISNLSAIFPPAQDRFLFGPMAIIGWGGAPPILTMEIGIILELPEPVRLMILGRLRVTLPAQKDDSTQIAGASSGEQEKNQDTPKIKLQLDSLGIINFGTGDISLDAYLYDSTIGPFTITGGMALRASFGAKPLFILSVGGFHPAFQAPAGFPSIERVALGLHKKESGLEVRLQLAAYFALTSNTVQFGAHLDLYVHVWEFEIVGLLGFDALIQFQPFGLIASFEAMVSVKAFGLTLMAVRLQVNATGPSPWHVWGKAQFTLLFFSGTAEFDALIGHEATPAPPPPIDVEQELFAELQKHSNWSSQLPEGEHPLLTFRDSSSSKDLSGTSPKKKVFIHPLAELHVNQRLVPLNSDPITRYGTTTPTGATTFMLEAKVDDEAVAASLLNAPPLSDWFARAQFYVMSDAEKLAAPSFEEKNSGIRVQAAEGYISGTPVGSVMKAAQTGKDGIQSNLEAAKFLDRVAHLGAAGQAPIRAAGPAKYGDPSWWDQGITLRKAGYRVVGEEDDGAAPKVRATRRGEASSPSSLFEEAKATVAEPVMSYSAARARATRARQRAPKRRTWVVPDIGVKRGDR